MKDENRNAGADRERAMERKAMKVKPKLHPSALRPHPSHESGQVLVWTIVMLPLLLALVGLVFDGGMLFVQHRRARWAADGAAVVAASEIGRRTVRRHGP